MDNRLKEIIDNFDKLKIGIDDIFRFHCTQCGKCCINREDILLNPKDLFNLAKGLNISIADVIKQYCEVYLGQDSRIPIVRLLPKGQVKRCPFLKDRKCSVHKFKPTVCATFPLGRVMTYSAGKEMPQNITPGEVQYIFTNPGCGDDSETHTVREWLSDFDIALEDEFFMKWNKFISSLGSFIRVAEKKFLEKRLNQILDTVFASVYCLYDTNNEFLPQFERNVKMLEVVLKKHGYKKEALWMNDERNQNQIIRIDARNCFVESLNDAFAINKVHFAFATYDLSKPEGQRQTNSVHIYISVYEFLELCRRLYCGSLLYQLQQQKNSGNNTPLYKTMGGTSAERLAAQNRSRADGRSLSRTAQLICGTKSDFLFVADSGPGETDAKGLIVPKFGRNPENHVAVSMSMESLGELFLATKTHYEAWLAARYIYGTAGINYTQVIPTQSQNTVPEQNHSEGPIF